MSVLVDRAGNSCFVDRAGNTVFFDQVGNLLTCEAIADNVLLLGQACLWSFDDLVDWSKGNSKWHPL